MSDYFKIEENKSSLIIRFNRPELYNAMNRQMKLDLISLIRKSARREDLRCLILTGEGKAFTSGQDLNDRTVAGGQEGVDLGETLETEWNPLVTAIRESRLPIIAAVNGVVAGAGISVALSCDFIIAAPKVKFVSGFAQIGLAPDAGSSHLFVRTLGYCKALHFFLSGKPMFSEELEQAGLINEVSPDFLECALEYGQMLEKLSPTSTELIKRNLAFARDYSLRDTLVRETQTQRFLGKTEDYKGATEAFLNKKPYQFTGR